MDHLGLSQCRKSNKNSALTIQKYRIQIYLLNKSKLVRKTSINDEKYLKLG